MAKQPSKLEKKFSLYWLGIKGQPLVAEHRFCKRMWRFDFAHPKTKVAIEIEGGTWVGGAHSRGAHYRSDCEKYNAATKLGWRVFRLTTDMITTSNLEEIADFIACEEHAEGMRP